MSVLYNNYHIILLLLLLFLLLRSQLYLWVHHFGWDYCICDCCFNQTIEVVTFHIRGCYNKTLNLPLKSTAHQFCTQLVACLTGQVQRSLARLVLDVGQVRASAQHQLHALCFVELGTQVECCVAIMRLLVQAPSGWLTNNNKTMVKTMMVMMKMKMMITTIIIILITTTATSNNKLDSECAIQH